MTTTDIVPPLIDRITPELRIAIGVRDTGELLKALAELAIKTYRGNHPGPLLGGVTLTTALLDEVRDITDALETALEDGTPVDLHRYGLRIEVDTIGVPCFDVDGPPADRPLVSDIAIYRLIEQLSERHA